MNGPDPILDHLIYTNGRAGVPLRRTKEAAQAFWFACTRMRLMRLYVRKAAA